MKVQTALRSDSFEILGNELWLEIAFTNLLNNALKYSGNKPVKVTLSHTAKKCKRFMWKIKVLVSPVMRRKRSLLRSIEVVMQAQEKGMG
jgi:signal transduction histidine kinase